MNRKYHVNLSDKERKSILKHTNTTDIPKTLRKRCQILLLADESSGQPLIYDEIALRCGVSDVTVYTTIKDYHTLGLTHVLRRRIHQQPPRKALVSGEIEARIVALACGAAPDGYTRWTIRLLQEKVVELKIMDSVGRETIRTTLKKLNLNLT